MKRTKKIFCVIMTLAFVFAFAYPAPAAYASTKTITEGEWLYAHSNADYYKIVVSGEGYLTITSKSETAIPYYEILNSKKHVFSDQSFVDGGFDGSETIKVAVSKGTYYIHYFGDEDCDTACVKYTFTPIKQKTNYCKAKVITLKRGKTTKIYQTPKYGFDRYYKIRLSTARKITVYSGSYVDIFDSKRNCYDTDTEFTDDSYIFKHTTEKKLPKGTYYIVSRVQDPGQSAIYKLKWH